MRKTKLSEIDILGESVKVPPMIDYLVHAEISGFNVITKIYTLRITENRVNLKWRNSRYHKE